MRKRAFVVAAVGLAAVLIAGGMVASNMGFKANYALDNAGTNGSLSGTQSIALPYNRQVGIDTAAQLIDDIDASGADAVEIQRYDSATDSHEAYPGIADFPLEPGCIFAADDSEDDPAFPPQCANGNDDDQNGRQVGLGIGLKQQYRTFLQMKVDTTL